MRRAARRRSAGAHPLNRALAIYGVPQTIAADVDLDFGGQRFVARKLFVGERWICYVGKGQVTIQRIATLVWVYPEINVLRSRGMIQSWRTARFLILLDIRSRVAALPLNKSNQMAMVASIQKQAPCIKLGYSEVMNENWNSDRAELIALIAARQAQAEHLAGPTHPQWTG